MPYSRRPQRMRGSTEERGGSRRVSFRVGSLNWVCVGTSELQAQSMTASFFLRGERTRGHRPRLRYMLLVGTFILYAACRTSPITQYVLNKQAAVFVFLAPD